MAAAPKRKRADMEPDEQEPKQEEPKEGFGGLASIACDAKAMVTFIAEKC